jgi:hypothetical protein
LNFANAARARPESAGIGGNHVASLPCSNSNANAKSAWLGLADAGSSGINSAFMPQDSEKPSFNNACIRKPGPEKPNSADGRMLPPDATQVSRVKSF